MTGYASQSAYNRWASCERANVSLLKRTCAGMNPARESPIQ